MKNKKKISFIILTIGIILLITIGISYAYFSANITGSEYDTTITVTGGVMNIHFDGGADINVEAMFPNDVPFAIKTFTVTGNSTTSDEMNYNLSLIVEENTFTDDSLKYKLISTNTDNNGKIAPSINNMENIKEGSNSYLLGNGSFNGPTNGNKVHTYNLELYFPDTGENQNVNQGKSIKAYISIKEGIVINYQLANNNDFEFVAFSSAPNTYSNGKGYFKYVGNKEYIILPEEINENILKDYYRMFYQNNIIKGVRSNNDKITDMNGMFWESKGKTLELELNTSNVTNMTNMFRNNAATELDLSSFNTSNVTSMQLMFSSNKANNLDLSSFNTTKVTNMSQMFWESSASNLNISSFDTSNVRNMQGMFYKSLATNLNLSNFNTGRVTNMSAMFVDSKTKNLNLSSFNTSNVTNMNSMFKGSDAETVNLSSFNTSNVTDIGHMFQETQISILDLSNFDTQNVTTMNATFNDTTANIIGLENLNVSKVTNMNGTFSAYKNTSLNLKNWDTSNVKFMDVMFGNGYVCDGLTCGSSSEYGNSGKTNLTTVIFGDRWNTTNVTSMQSIFSTSSVSDVDTIYMNWDLGNIINANGLFNDVKISNNIINISDYNFDYSKLKEVKNMFANSPALTLDLRSFDTSGITDMNNMFYQSKALNAYASTQTDADKFNLSYGKPSGLNFVVR